MEINNRVSNYRHLITRKSSSSRHFHDLFSFTTTTNTDVYGGEDLTEADLFSDSSESTHSPISIRNNNRNHNNLGFSGILAALSDENGTRFSTSTTAATQFRSIPKPQPLQQRVTNEWTQSVPSRNFHHHQQHSAPMNVPMMMKKPKKFGQLDEFQDYNKDEDDDEEMLPPHEIVAMKLKSTSSVLEGVGRTLKGRDLRQVRNAVWRQTGFLD